MLRITTALLLLSPAIASAQCLTADSLDGGITVEYAGGNISHIQRQPDGTILDAYYDNDSYYKQVILFESQDGVLDFKLVVHEPETWEARNTTRKTYDFDVTSLAPYTAGMRGVGLVTWEGDGYSDGEKKFSWYGYESEPLVLGECSYDAVRVFTYELGTSFENMFIREIKYLPALGIGLQLGNSYFNWSTESSTIVSLSAG